MSSGNGGHFVSVSMRLKIKYHLFMISGLAVSILKYCVWLLQYKTNVGPVYVSIVNCMFSKYIFLEPVPYLNESCSCLQPSLHFEGDHAAISAHLGTRHLVVIMRAQSGIVYSRYLTKGNQYKRWIITHNKSYINFETRIEFKGLYRSYNTYVVVGKWPSGHWKYSNSVSPKQYADSI